LRFVQKYSIGIPYATFALILGYVYGLLETHFQTLENFEPILSNLPSEEIIYIYVPVVVFRMAFYTDIHSFIRILPQILVISFPSIPQQILEYKQAKHLCCSFSAHRMYDRYDNDHFRYQMGILARYGFWFIMHPYIYCLCHALAQGNQHLYQTRDHPFRRRVSSHRGDSCHL
jgi:hypothetical protein